MSTIYVRSRGGGHDDGSKQVATTVWTGQKLAFQYVWSEIKRQRSSYVIGLFTVFLVVFFVTLLTNSVLKSPIIFFKISEDGTGETDLLITPGTGVMDKIISYPSPIPSLNHTRYDQVLANKPLVAGSAPRWLIISSVSLFDPVTATPTSVNAVVLGLNSTREAELPLGRNWPFGPLASDECYVSSTVLRQIGLSDPDRAVDDRVSINLRVSLTDLLSAFDLASIGGTSSSSSSSSSTTVSPDDLRRLIAAAGYPEINTLWSTPVNLTGFANFDLKNATGIDLDRLLSNSTLFPFSLNTTVTVAQFVQNALNISIPLEDVRISIVNAQGISINVTLADLIGLNNLNQPVDTFLSERLNLTLPSRTPAGLNRTEVLRFTNQLTILTRDNFPGFSANFTTILLQNEASTGSEQPILSLNDLVNQLVRNSANGGLTVGDVVTLLFPLSNLAVPNGGLTGAFSRNFRVAGVVGSPSGKWSTAVGSVAVLEAGALFDLVRGGVLSLINFRIDPTIRIGGLNFTLPGVPVLTPESLLPFLGVNSSVVEGFSRGLESLNQTIRSAQPGEYTLVGNVMYRNRLSAYIKDLGSLKSEMIDFTNEASTAIGYNELGKFNTPLAIALEQTKFVRYFLDNIFGSVITLLVILGVLLIYSLLLNDVERKTYEYGMLRALGMRHRTLCQLLLTKALMFAIPAIGLGLLFAFLGNLPITMQISDFARIPRDYSLDAKAVGLSVALGLIMPLVANIVPISRALSRTLRDALDVYHASVSEITVRLIKLSEMGLDHWQTAIAVLMIGAGVLTFYLIPYAFTFQDIPMFLGVLTAILLGMLFGLCILAQLVQPYMERLVLWLLIPCGHRHLHSLVKKNLAGHRDRNRKTAQMFTLCLAFIIFCGTMFALQSRSLSDNVRVFFGADLIVQAPSLKDELAESSMTSFLRQEQARRIRGEPGAVLDDFTFVTFALNKLPYIDRTRVSNLPDYPESRTLIYGLQKNYLNVVYSDYLMVREHNSGSSYPRTREGDPDSVAVLFSDKGKARLPIEESTSPNGGLHIPPSILSGLDKVPLGDATLDRNVTVSEQAGIRQSYSEYVDVIVSEALREQNSISTATPLVLMVRSQLPTGFLNQEIYLAKARAMVSKVPGFFFSSYRQTAGFAPALIREDSFQRFYRDVFVARGLGEEQSVTLAPKQKLLIRVTPGATKKLRDDIINGLRVYFKSDRTTTLDTQDLVESAAQAVSLMNLFFTVVGAVAMVLCFFILFLSFTANVSENSWEFGVLRSLGLTGFQVVMIYVYEALALVLSSLILGLIIGLLIAASLTLQFNLFTEMPFRMDFPRVLFTVMSTMAVGVAIIGSVIPAVRFLRKPISTVLRRQ